MRAETSNTARYLISLTDKLYGDIKCETAKSLSGCKGKFWWPARLFEQSKSKINDCPLIYQGTEFGLRPA